MSTIAKYAGRLALQQRVLPAYRASFFDALAESCTGGLSVFAGLPQPQEHIATTDRLQVARFTKARNMHFLNIDSPLYQCWQAGILDWLESWQPDALIVEANSRYPSTRLAVRWMHGHSRPVLGWGLGAPPLTGRLAGWRRLTRESFLKTLDGVIAYSKRGADEYRAVGFPAGRVFVAPNAVAHRPDTPPPERPDETQDQLVVLFVGRLQARKRIDHLLHACAALPVKLQPRLRVVGDGPARAELQDLASSVYPAAEFPGACYGDELKGYFTEADIFVLPGTGGLAVQEAMTYGLPVIVAQGDGTQSDLVRPDNGWSIPSDDLNALTAALHVALSNPPDLRRKGAKSYRIVAEEVNLEVMVEIFLHALEAIGGTNAKAI